MYWLQWQNQYDGLRHFNRNDYNWCYVQSINRINERLQAELLANPLPKPPPPPTRRTDMAYAPTQKPDGTPITVLDLTDIPADMPDAMRPDANLVGWLDKMEKEAVEKMCEDLETLDAGYCRKVAPVRQSAICTLKKKYVTKNSMVRFCLSFICYEILLTHNQYAYRSTNVRATPLRDRWHTLACV